jgi:Tfp pilus assembly protein PilN
MASTNKLSFLPDDYLERKAQRRTNTIFAILFVLVIAGVVTAFTVSERTTKDQDERYAQMEQQFLNEAKRLDQVKKMQEKQQRMAHQAELTASLLERVPRTSILAELTNALPPGCSLLDFQMESRAIQRANPGATAGLTAYEQQKKAMEAAKATAAAPAAVEPQKFDVGMKVTGLAKTDVQVAQFLNKLSKSRLLKDVNLAISEEFLYGTNEKDKDKEKLRKFQIEMMLDPVADVEPANPKNSQVTTIDK